MSQGDVFEGMVGGFIAGAAAVALMGYGVGSCMAPPRPVAPQVAASFTETANLRARLSAAEIACVRESSTLHDHELRLYRLEEKLRQEQVFTNSHESLLSELYGRQLKQASDIRALEKRAK